MPLFCCSASGCPLASKNKALREQLTAIERGNVKYSNGSSQSFGNRLAALSGNSYDPEGLSQDKTSASNDPNDEKVSNSNSYSRTPILSLIPLQFSFTGKQRAYRQGHQAQQLLRKLAHQRHVNTRPSKRAHHPAPTHLRQRPREHGAI